MCIRALSLQSSSPVHHCSKHAPHYPKLGFNPIGNLPLPVSGMP